MKLVQMAHYLWPSFWNVSKFSIFLVLDISLYFCAWIFLAFVGKTIFDSCFERGTKKNSLTDAITYSHMIRYALLHAAADVASTHLKSPNTKNLCCKHFESEKQSEKLFFFHGKQSIVEELNLRACYCVCRGNSGYVFEFLKN